MNDRSVIAECIMEFGDDTGIKVGPQQYNDKEMSNKTDTGTKIHPDKMTSDYTIQNHHAWNLNQEHT